MNLILSSLAFAVTPVASDSLLNSSAPVAVHPHAELGFLAPLAHTIQFGRDGSTLDYVVDGGQDVLFPVSRFSVDADIGRSTVVFLYQPLDLRSEVTPSRDLVVDGVTFAAGQRLSLRYGFSFWRASYLYDLAPGDEELALGGGLQVRDAIIEFATVDQVVSNRDVGPVPLLKLRARQDLPGQWWIGTEVDGIWAPIKYLNGDDVDVEGALLDASLRTGVSLRQGTDTFVNLRYLGGGAEGSGRSDGQGDGYTANWLHFATVSLGVTLR